MMNRRGLLCGATRRINTPKNLFKHLGRIRWQTLFTNFSGNGHTKPQGVPHAQQKSKVSKACGTPRNAKRQQQGQGSQADPRELLLGTAADGIGHGGLRHIVSKQHHTPPCIGQFFKLSVLIDRVGQS